MWLVARQPEGMLQCIILSLIMAYSIYTDFNRRDQGVQDAAVKLTIQAMYCAETDTHTDRC